jgi:4'-phosphopantetheinyl transferase
MMKVLVSEDIWDFDLEEALKGISAQRREQALKFKYEQGQRLCVLAYQLLKEGLQQAYGITDSPLFEYNEHGKPSIVDHPEIHFNLSHCKEAAICVVSDQPVGVDVESLRQYKDGLAEYTMNEKELHQIKTAPNPDSEFIRLWTMKEATTKLTGTGISDNLKSVIDITRYKYTTVERQQYIYTICTYSNGLQDRCQEDLL